MDLAERSRDEAERLLELRVSGGELDNHFLNLLREWEWFINN